MNTPKKIARLYDRNRAANTAAANLLARGVNPGYRRPSAPTKNDMRRAAKKARTIARARAAGPAPASRVPARARVRSFIQRIAAAVVRPFRRERGNR